MIDISLSDLAMEPLYDEAEVENNVDAIDPNEPRTFGAIAIETLR